VLDAQFFTGGEVAFDDVAAQAPVGGFDQGFGFGAGWAGFFGVLGMKTSLCKLV
jgi:hypothetical protein